MVDSRLQVGKKFKFNTLAPGVLGASFSNMVLTGIVDYTIASMMVPIKDQHRMVYPVLPQGSSDNYEAYTYLVFKAEGSNSSAVFAVEWIDLNSLTSDFRQSAVIRVQDITGADAILIRNILKMNNFNNFTIEITDIGNAA